MSQVPPEAGDDKMKENEKGAAVGKKEEAPAKPLEKQPSKFKFWQKKKTKKKKKEKEVVVPETPANQTNSKACIIL